MSNKSRTIQACRDLAEKYRKPQGKDFFLAKSCNLCIIHAKLVEDYLNCHGCPLAEESGLAGCSGFRSNQNARRALLPTALGITYSPNKRTSVHFYRRAEFFERIIPLLEQIPASRFTKKGWKYFKELDRSW